MEKLTARTVFHEIYVQQKNGDDSDDEKRLENDDYTTSSASFKGRESSRLAPSRINSDEEWDTDLEDEGDNTLVDLSENKPAMLHQMNHCHRINSI